MYGGLLKKIFGGITTLGVILGFLLDVMDIQERIGNFFSSSPEIEEIKTDEKLPKEKESEIKGDKKTVNAQITYIGDGHPKRVEYSGNKIIYHCQKTGNRYEVDKSNNTATGRGTLYIKQKGGGFDVYVGDFCNFQPDGQGNMKYYDGSVLSGKWSQGVYAGN